MSEPREAADFPAWLIELRPALFRYCSRVLGSVIEGEDATQETLLKALYALDGQQTIERPRQWLFRIAHNVSLDALRKRSARGEVGLGVEPEGVAADEADVRIRIRSGFAVFLALPETERAAVLMKDVLDFQTVEIAESLGVPVSSVQNWIHRGRAHLRALATEPDRPVKDERLLQLFADRFNVGDWAGLRDLLAHDVSITLVGAAEMQPSTYIGNYARLGGLLARVATIEGQLGIALYQQGSSAVANVLILECAGDRIAYVRDYRYADHVLQALHGV